MSLSVKCPKGHSYVSGDIYVNWPEEAPRCPVCFKEWEQYKNIIYANWNLNGPFIQIEWGVKDVGFGLITFIKKDDGEIVIDPEFMSRTFVKNILDYLIDHTKFTDEKEKE